MQIVLFAKVLFSYINNCTPYCYIISKIWTPQWEYKLLINNQENYGQSFDTDLFVQYDVLELTVSVVAVLVDVAAVVAAVSLLMVEITGYRVGRYK